MIEILRLLPSLVELVIDELPDALALLRALEINDRTGKDLIRRSEAQVNLCPRLRYLALHRMDWRLPEESAEMHTNALFSMAESRARTMRTCNNVVITDRDARTVKRIGISPVSREFAAVKQAFCGYGEITIETVRMK